MRRIHLFGTCSRLSLFGGATSAAHPEFPKHHLERTEVGEGGLDEVEADEGGEPEPKWAVIMSQQEAEENKATGESANNHFHKQWY